MTRRQYHGRHVFQDPSESPMERAEREEQRFRRRHDRLHRTQQLHAPERRADAQVRGVRADVWDEDLDDLDNLDDPTDDDAF